MNFTDFKRKLIINFVKKLKETGADISIDGDIYALGITADGKPISSDLYIGDIYIDSNISLPDAKVIQIDSTIATVNIDGNITEGNAKDFIDNIILNDGVHIDTYIQTAGNLQFESDFIIDDTSQVEATFTFPNVEVINADILIGALGIDTVFTVASVIPEMSTTIIVYTLIDSSITKGNAGSISSTVDNSISLIANILSSNSKSLKAMVEVIESIEASIEAKSSLSSNSDISFTGSISALVGLQRIAYLNTYDSSLLSELDSNSLENVDKIIIY